MSDNHEDVGNIVANSPEFKKGGSQILVFPYKFFTFLGLLLISLGFSNNNPEKNFMQAYLTIRRKRVRSNEQRRKKISDYIIK